MANQNRTAADVMREMNQAPENATGLDALADEFVQKLATEPQDGTEAPAQERPRRQRPPRDVKASA